MRKLRSTLSIKGWALIGLAAMWLLAACAGPSQDTGSTNDQAPPADQPAATETAAAPALESESTPTRRLGSAELHATDPSSVTLASGKVQLVEFFAFW
jgi:hypothetical protein